MVLEKKMLIFSFLAILIGIASILPLPFLMSGKATVATDGTEAKAQFNLNLPYVFIKINGSGPDLSYEQQYFPEQFKPRFSGTIYEESYVRNVTCLANPEEGLPEAVAEYFNIQVYTDTEILVNKTTFYGGMFSALDIEAESYIQFKIDKW